MASIKKRNNTYTIMVSLGYDTTGTQIRKYMTYIPDKSLSPIKIEKEVQRQAVLFEEKCKKGLYLDGNITFSEFAEKWFTDYAEKQLKAKTIRNYKIFLKRVNLAIGHIKLDRLQPHHLIKFYNNLKEKGIRKNIKYRPIVDFKVLVSDMKLTKAELSRKSCVSVASINSLCKGNNVNFETATKICECLNLILKNIFVATDSKPLSDDTVHHYHTFISSVLSTAVIWQIIMSNPCERVKPPKVTRKEAKYLNEKNLNILLEILDNLPEKDQQNKLMIKILLFTGLRKGELCGLKFDDVDFDNNTISIKRNLLYIPEKGVFEDTPKTESSIRTISISDNIIELLKTHRDLQKKRQIDIGDRWNETGYIFTAWNGSHLHPDTISSWFSNLVKKHNLPNITIHSLRHTAATMLIMNGLPVQAVSSRLGHTNAITTSTIYSHTLKTVDEKAAEIMDGILSSKKA